MLHPFLVNNEHLLRGMVHPQASHLYTMNFSPARPRPGEPSPSSSGAALPYSPEGDWFVPSIPLYDPRASSPPQPSFQPGLLHPYVGPTESGFVAEGSSLFPSTAHAPPLPTDYLPWNSFHSSSSIAGPSESVYLGRNALQHNAVATGSQAMPPHEREHKVRGVFPYMAGPALTSGAAMPASSHPEHIVLWYLVCRDAVVVNGPREFVPQIIYQPHSQGDKKRYVSLAELHHPIIFLKQDSPEWGIPIQHLLSKQAVQLVEGNEPAFTSCGPSIGIRVQWSGYRPFHKQVSTKDYTPKRNMISKGKLAKVVAKFIKQCMDTMSEEAMQIGSDGRWRVGPVDIRVDDVILVSLHHVSQGSWQPHLRLRRTIDTIVAARLQGQRQS